IEDLLAKQFVARVERQHLRNVIVALESREARTHAVAFAQRCDKFGATYVEPRIFIFGHHHEYRHTRAVADMRDRRAGGVLARIVAGVSLPGFFLGSAFSALED